MSWRTLIDILLIGMCKTAVLNMVLHLLQPAMLKRTEPEYMLLQYSRPLFKIQLAHMQDLSCEISVNYAVQLAIIRNSVNHLMYPAIITKLNPLDLLYNPRIHIAR
ncbi:hypothetical protein VPH35_112315 [Triticum aestivum]